MCSIYCSNLEKDNYDKVNFYLKLRGPDHTNVIKANGYTFLHNLLSMTGEFTVQPFTKEDTVCLYNGEIYNFKSFGDYKSDGECLIPLYEEHGDEFIKKLDGEFAVILFDFKNDKIIIASDVFKTKPIFYSVANDKFGCSTYKTPLDLMGHVDVKKMPPNTVKIFKISTLEEQRSYQIYDFNLDQYKDSFEDWNLAFKESMKKRISNSSQKIFLGLSSGYDSGGICLELLNQNVPFKAYSVIDEEYSWANAPKENKDVLERRWKLIENSEFGAYERLHKTQENYVRSNSTICNQTEPFLYTIDSVCPHTNHKSYSEYIDLSTDSGSNWLALVCERAKEDGIKMYLSGMGADEVFSDYGFKGKKYFGHSNFGGLFPKDLSAIFPWNSFHGSTMESYLAKEEYVGGSFGLEARYPYLDTKVVQEFLNLTQELKNNVYKSVIDNYLTEHDYPFARGEKRGF
ncbi:hypothetical protein CMI37_09675 [Candidatus Pacearchaeota archaeon]|nr:hypothetical protein [Candidatus Pacearchaeota archaeon]|tara:strand:+ start:1630 stop:3003 length:1374 start_codon:yes stop_codon:yes gene_type:complete